MVYVLFSTHMTKKTSVSDTLRKAIVNCGMSFKSLERESGVTRQSLMEFARGNRELRGDMIDRLAAYFQFELVPAKTAKRKGN